MSVYIQSANQISAQQPLSDEWFDRPVFYDGIRVPAIDPDFKDYFSPMEARRKCTLLKRAVVTSRLTLRDASVETPDAIISSTGLGCIENTEKFLRSIMENDEKFLQPTFFMQSTHNILSSSIAIELKCHGYNNTFVHRGTSFENALLDAFMQFEQKRVKTVLIGGYDELTDDYFKFLERIGIWDFVPGPSPERKCFAGDVAVSMLLGTERNGDTICEISDVELMYKPAADRLRERLDLLLAKAGCGLPDIDAVLTGLNTNPANDKVYNDVILQLFDNCPVLQYKHLFGESFSSSALAVYVAATCLHKNRIPSFLPAYNPPAHSGAVENRRDIKDIKHILIYNHYRNKSHSFILLSSCSN
ncbi:MAG: beta-ketoacyl synthase chain length factor [Tannerella sp.]|jgi:3-oxoacyl-(acyl-carrier-protein) synthase|nr:beta-ketoacyl synthase chain length factor [Tannerella sp.]